MYKLSEAVKATGIAKPTLQAWERRYNAVTPDRTETDRRLYTLENIRRLRLLKAGVDLGHRISSLAKLDDEKLRTLCGPEGYGKHFALLESIRQMDFRAFERRLSAAYSTLPAAEFINDIVVPLMVDIGDLWEHGLLPLAAEHMATALIRSYLTSSLRMGSNSQSKMTMIFTTFEGDLHEIGLLSAAVVAHNLKVDCIYLGPQLPPKEIAAAALLLHADVICIGATMLSEKAMLETMGILSTCVSDGVKIWVGGRAAKDLKVPPNNFEALPSLKSFEGKIQKEMLEGTRHRKIF